MTGSPVWSLVFRHFDVEIVSFAGPLAHPGETAHAAVGFGDIVNELLNEYGLADARTAKEPDFAPLAIRGKEVDDLDAGLEDLYFGRLLHERGGGPVDGHARLGANRRTVVDRIADDVENAAKALRTHRHRNGSTRVPNGGAPDKAISGVHGHRPNDTFPHMRCDFESQIVRCA